MCRQGNANMMRTRLTIEIPGRNDDATLCEPAHGIPAGFTASQPEIQSGIAALLVKARGHKRVEQELTPVSVSGALFINMGIVLPRCNRRVLHGQRHHAPEMLSDFEETLDDCGITRDKTTSIAGHIRPLGKRVQGQNSPVVIANDVGMQDGQWLHSPAQFDVALIAHDDPRMLPGSGNSVTHGLGGEDMAGWITRGIEPGEVGCCRPNVNRAPGEGSTNRVGGISDFGYGNRIAGSEVQQSWELSDELLRPNHGEHRTRFNHHAMLARQPIRAGVA